MKRRTAKSGTRKPSRRSQPKSSRLPTGKHAGAETAKASRLPSRAVVMRLAAEVDALAAQLQDSRARILDLEARVDVDPLTDVLNRRGFRARAQALAGLRQALRHQRGADLYRSRRLQAGQRPPRPRRRRRGAQGGGGGAHSQRARLRRGRAHRRRRIRRAVVERLRRRCRRQGRRARSRRVRNAGALERFDLVVGASAGVALLGALDSPAEVIARADAAMYARKAERKGVLPLRGEKEQVTQ